MPLRTKIYEVYRITVYGRGKFKREDNPIGRVSLIGRVGSAFQYTSDVQAKVRSKFGLKANQMFELERLQ